MSPISVDSLLICPDCRSSLPTPATLSQCSHCGRVFEREGNLFQMLPSKGLPMPIMYSDSDYLKFLSVYDEVLSYHYEQKNLVKKINDHYHQKINQWMSCQEGTYLDLGCGNGAHWEGQKNISQWTGLDLSLKALQAMQLKFPKALLIQGDVCALPFESHSLDGVFALAILEHIYYLDEALQEISRVLKPNGTLLMSIPTEGGLLWNTGRKLTTDQYFSKKYGIDHARVVKITHCNTAKTVLAALSKHFSPLRLEFDPFRVPWVDVNLFVHGIFKKRGP